MQKNIIIIKMMKNFGALFKYKREQMGLTQEAVAKKAGIGAKYISMIENGHSTPSGKIFIKLLEALELELPYKDLTFFKNKKVLDFMLESAPFISKLSKRNLNAISQMIRLMVNDPEDN
ncbi:MAG: helix-turn-helix transcriptional regulator [bacterium]|nr:helix-turn-helix transcriptional regulator [bacterium]